MKTYLTALQELGQWTLSKKIAEARIEQLTILGLKLNDELSKTASTEGREAKKAKTAKAKHKSDSVPSTAKGSTRFIAP